jgi:hypothetical protein
MNWRFACARRIFNTRQSALLKAGADIADCVAMHVEFHAYFNVAHAFCRKQQGSASSCDTVFKSSAAQQ